MFQQYAEGSAQRNCERPEEGPPGKVDDLGPCLRDLTADRSYCWYVWGTL